MMVVPPPLLTMGTYTACAHHDDGSTPSVYCWGENTHGLVGTGSTFPSGETVPLPVFAPDVKQVVFGGQHACRLTPMGIVLCWGQTDYGALGRALMPTLGDDPDPKVVVPGIMDAIDLAAAWSTTCAVRSGDKISCWGSTEYRQIGDPGLSPLCGSTQTFQLPCQGLPVDLAMPNHSGTWSKIYGSRLGSFCAVSTTGDVACWGAAPKGRLLVPAGSTLDCQGMPCIAPTIIPGFKGADEIALGGGATCARFGGAVKCAGANYTGELGQGFADEADHPTLAATITSGSKKIVAGENHFCSIAGPTKLECWGSNDQAQLAINPNMSPNKCGLDFLPCAFSPTTVPGVTDVLDVTAGYATTCIRKATDLSIWCWGNNSFGVLGFAMPFQSDQPTFIDFAPPAAGPSL